MKTILKTIIILVALYFLTGCGLFKPQLPAQIVTKDKLQVVPLDKNLFDCPKPGPVKAKFSNLANKEVYEKELDAAFNEAYAAQVTCYKSMEANKPDTEKK
jgi:hypothetical protein